MNKSKLLVMAFTFVILIAITPFIFSKLMNSKFNQMLDKYRSEGYKIELIEDKSSYVTTDKVFNVVIPGNKLDLKDIKNLNLKVEVVFKNLPVTNVTFDTILKKVILSNNQEIDFKDRIEAVIVTPNFKEFSYKLKDIYYQDNSGILTLKGVKGNFRKDFTLFVLKSSTLIFKDKNSNQVEIRDLEVKTQKDENSEFSKVRLNVVWNEPNFTYQINGLEFSNRVFGDKTTQVNLGFKFKNFIIPNIAEFDKFDSKLEISNLKLSLKDISSYGLLPKASQEELVISAIQKGFDLSFRGKVKNIKSLASGEDLKGISVDLSAKVLPFDIKKVDMNKLDFLHANLRVVVSNKIVSFFKSINPQMTARFLVLARENGSNYVLNLEFDKGKLLVNE